MPIVVKLYASDYVGLYMKTQVRTVMSPGNHNKLVPVSTYTCPNGNVLTFRGGNSEKVLKGVQAVEALGLSRFEIQTLRDILDNLDGIPLKET